MHREVQYSNDYCDGEPILSYSHDVTGMPDYDSWPTGCRAGVGDIGIYDWCDMNENKWKAYIYPYSSTCVRARRLNQLRAVLLTLLCTDAAVCSTSCARLPNAFADGRHRRLLH